MHITLNVQFEKAVRLLTEHFPVSDESSRKPILFHDIRVGVYLYENSYSEDVVLAGVLHDAIEWSDITEQMIQDQFGKEVLSLVLANTKDRSIKDKSKIVDDLIARCVAHGEEALIIKAVDTIDSFKWYESQKNREELTEHCVKTADAIMRHKPDHFDNKIFDELEVWRMKSV